MVLLSSLELFIRYRTGQVYLYNHSITQNGYEMIVSAVVFFFLPVIIATYWHIRIAPALLFAKLSHRQERNFVLTVTFAATSVVWIFSWLLRYLSYLVYLVSGMDSLSSSHYLLWPYISALDFATTFYYLMMGPFITSFLNPIFVLILNNKVRGSIQNACKRIIKVQWA